MKQALRGFVLWMTDCFLYVSLGRVCLRTDPDGSVLQGSGPRGRVCPASLCFDVNGVTQARQNIHGVRCCVGLEAC